MKIAIVVRPPLRRWQCRLAAALREAGHGVVFAKDADRGSVSPVEVALALQKRLFGPRLSFFDRVQSHEDHIADVDRLVAGSADFLIVLDGANAEGGSRLELLFDRSTGDAALLAMVSGDGAPCVELQATINAESTAIVVATLAIEDRDTLCCALDQVLARVVSLVLQGVRRIETGVRSSEVARPTSLPGRPLRHIARALVRKVASRLSPGSRGPDHWRVGVRRKSDRADGRLKGSWPASRFHIIPDDRSRFYADPIPFTHAGRRFIFVEDFPYATGKGVIAVTEIGEDCVASQPRTVLEQPGHLSYPFLVRHGGEIYMLPETSSAGRVQLFRAAPFPDRWIADRILLDGIVAADATVIEHAGRWWMFAAISDDGGSSWDQLGLFHAPDLFGPWVAHADNPVLVDAGAARPAGAMWHEDGVLMRVAQDCRRGYGDGLAICRVDRLDEKTYRQTVVARLSPPDGTGAGGVHTLGSDGDLEVIDLRFSSARR